MKIRKPPIIVERGPRFGGDGTPIIRASTNKPSLLHPPKMAPAKPTLEIVPDHFLFPTFVPVEKYLPNSPAPAKKPFVIGSQPVSHIVLSLSEVGNGLVIRAGATWVNVTIDEAGYRFSIGDDPTVSPPRTHKTVFGSAPDLVDGRLSGINGVQPHHFSLTIMDGRLFIFDETGGKVRTTIEWA